LSFLNKIMKEPRITPNYISELKNNEIFVFGSNEAGIHGAGAAKLARDKFGARQFCGSGHFGKTFAIPTKDSNIKTLPIEKIKLYIKRFIQFVRLHPSLTFLVTEIGCGLAGYEPSEIAPLFEEVINLENVKLPKRFWDVLIKQ